VSIVDGNDTSTIHDLIPVSAFFVMMKGAFATPKNVLQCTRDEAALPRNLIAPAAYFAPCPRFWRWLLLAVS